MDHPVEGSDADTLQARDHHVGIRQLQHLAVHCPFGDCAGRQVLRGRDPAQPLRRMDRGSHREAALLVGSAGRRRAGAGVYHSCAPGLRRREALPMMARADNLLSNPRMRLVSAALIVSMLLMAAGEGWPQVPTKPGSPDTAEQPNPQQDAPAQPAAALEGKEKTGLLTKL